MTDWITDRQPTEADADPDGDVLVRRSSTYSTALPWRFVATGAPWRRTGTFPAPAKLNTTVSYPRRFVLISRTILGNGEHILDAIADDGSAWWSCRSLCSQWKQLPSLPPREVPADA